MAENEKTDGDESASHHSDPQEKFITDVSKKYEKEDASDDDDSGAAAADGGAGGDGDAADDDDGEGDGKGDGGSADDADDDSADEHSKAGTSSDDSDGSDAESDKDSDDGDGADHPDKKSESDANADADGNASDDDADAAEGKDKDGEDDDDVDADGEDDISDETKAALERNGAITSLEDVPEKFRGVVQAKLKSIDSAFTKATQDARAYRKEEAKFRAEEKFRGENPDLVIVEMLQKDPNLFDKVNERFKKLDDADQAEAIKVVTGKKRQDAMDAVTAEMSTADRRANRADEVITYTQAKCAKLGVPFRLVEKAVANAILLKPEKERDVSNEEIDRIVADEKREYDQERRKDQRDASRTRVRTQSEHRKQSSPAAKAGSSGAASPRPAPAKKVKVDHTNEESRLDAMEASARRILSKSAKK